MPQFKWSVQTALDISSAAERVHQISSGTEYVLIDSDSEVYLRFDGVATADQIDTNNDVRWPMKSPDPIAVPAKAGVNGSVYLHIKQTASAVSEKARIVEL